MSTQGILSTVSHPSIPALHPGPAVESRGGSPRAARFIECRDPATLERLGQVEVLDAEAVRARVARGRRAQALWQGTSFAERRRVLRLLMDRILERKDEICRAAVRDSGKTLLDAAMGELFPVCEKIRYTLEHGERDLRTEERPVGLLSHKRARVEYHPLGVIGVISPWNFPFHNIFCPLVPALFAGNAVVVKVSEYAGGSVGLYQALIDEVLVQTGHPTDLCQLITGDGETGAALCSAGVEKIFFTGSPENGRKVMAQAAPTLTPVVLELGGKDPMVICDDADLEQAVSAAMLGVMTACGQMCVAAERLYVFGGIYDRFVGRVAEKIRALRQGPPLGETLVDVGATTMPRQLEIIEAQVADALGKGARLLSGGHRRAGLGGQYFEPTLLVDVDHRMRVAREETFGPVMTVIRVESEEEAIRLANDCAYGLGSSVFSRDRRRAERICARLSAGMTVINDYGVAYMAQSLPFGGVRQSGFGRINGREGLRACCNEKAVVSDRWPLHFGVPIYPVRAGAYELCTDVIGAIYADGLLPRVRSAARGLWRAARLLGG